MQPLNREDLNDIMNRGMYNRISEALNATEDYKQRQIDKAKRDKLFVR